MYKKRTQGWMKHADFILLDLLSLHGAFILAFFTRHGLGNWPYEIQAYRMIAGVMTIVDILAIILLNTLHGVLHRGFYKELAQTLKQAALVLSIVMAYLFSLQLGETYSRIVLYLTALFYIVISYATRLLWRRFFAHKKLLRMQRSLLIATTEALAKEVIGSLHARPYEVIKLLGLVILDRDMQGEKMHGLPVAANKDNTAEYLLREWVDEVYVYLPDGRCANTPKPELLVSQCLDMGVAVHVYLAEPVGIDGAKQSIERLGKYTVLTTSMNIATPLQAILKRTMDIIGGLAGCLVTCIILMFIAPVIRRQSPGPVIFKQQRIGKNGKRLHKDKINTWHFDAKTVHNGR